MHNQLFDGLFGDVKPDSIWAEDEEGRSYSYQTVFTRSARFANLLTSWGVKPGDRVMLQAPKSLDAIMLYLACIRLGAIFIPLNMAYTHREMAYFVAKATPKLLLCSSQRYEALQQIPTGKKSKLVIFSNDHQSPPGLQSMLDLADLQSDHFTNHPCGGDDLAAIVFTSGTTGQAKGAMISHNNLLSNGRILQKSWRFSAQDRLLHALPIFHAHGLFVALHVAFLAGAKVIFLRQFAVAPVLAHLPRATVFMGVPTYYTRLLSDPRLTKELVRNMRLFISGSAPLSLETHRAFAQRTLHHILERYGMSETNMNTANPYHGERRPGSVGFPLPGVSLRICDLESGQLKAPGEIGVIEVKGDNVFAGYWRMAKKTREEFRPDGFFITSDLGRIDQDGYVHIVGRSKDLIISGGYNVYPKEVEMVLDSFVMVVESAIIGVPHPDFGEGIIALVTLQEQADFNEQILLALLQPQIADYKQPKRIFAIAELPRNAMGKVQKSLLRAQYAKVFDANRCFGARPETST